MSFERPDDLDRGAVNRRAMLGDAWVERSLGQANSLNAEFQDQVTRHAWHDIWGRPGLDAQTRRLLVLGMTMGLARWEEFELHIFDRWGKLVFSSTSPAVGWDGKLPGGRRAMTGVYNWRLKARSIQTTSKRIVYGHVTLLQ